MAIRLSRSATEPENSANGIDITATPGTNYDLDEIVESKKRNSNSELNVQVSDKKSKTEGTIAVKTSDGKILMNNADAAKYLFGNEPSTSAYTPAVTLRRPIVIWEEGTLDDGTSERAESIYEQIAHFEDNIQDLKDLIEKRVQRELVECYNKITEVDNKFKDYYTSYQIDKNFYNNEKIDLKLTEIVNNCNNNYDKLDKEIDDKLVECYNKITEVDNKFKDYYTSSQIDNKFKDYYTSSQIDNKYEIIDSKLTEIVNNYDKLDKEIDDNYNDINNKYNDINNKYNDISGEIDSYHPAGEESEYYKVSCEYDNAKMKVRYLSQEIRVLIDKDAESEWFDNGYIDEHTYGDAVHVDATYTEGGYEKKECEICGHVEKTYIETEPKLFYTLDLNKKSVQDFTFDVTVNDAGLYEIAFKFSTTPAFSGYTSVYAVNGKGSTLRIGSNIDADGYSLYCFYVYLEEGKNTVTVKGQAAMTVTSARITYVTGVTDAMTETFESISKLEVSKTYTIPNGNIVTSTRPENRNTRNGVLQLRKDDKLSFKLTVDKKANFDLAIVMSNQDYSLTLTKGDEVITLGASDFALANASALKAGSESAQLYLANEALSLEAGEYTVTFVSKSNFILGGVYFSIGGEGADPNIHYLSFKAYAPEGAVYFKEDRSQTISDSNYYKIDTGYTDDESAHTNVGVEDDGREYSIIWFAMAFKNANGRWIYYGDTSSISHFMGYFYTVEWFDADKQMISKSSIRINIVGNEDQLNDPADHSIN